MIGLAAFLAIPILYFVGLRLSDRGISERRRIQRHYYTMFVQEMAEFEAGGGRVQDVNDATGSTRLLVPLPFVPAVALGLLLPLLLTWLGLPLWISALPMCAWIAIAGAQQWLLSNMLGMVDGAPPTSRRAAAAALGALLLKCALAMAGILTAGEGISRVNAGDWPIGLALDVAGFVLLTFCYLPVDLIERQVRKRDEVAFAEHAQTDAMLYLRSFADDEFRLYSPYGRLGPGFRFIPGRMRFEALLTACVSDRSGLLGVGHPDETLPMLGAQRTYWRHDAWKEAIRTTAARVDGLLVMAGRTPSLSWEMGQLADLGLLGKTLILFPPDGREATLERYRYVAEALHFPKNQQLPDHLKVALTAITFDDGDRPVHYMSGGRDWLSYMVTVTHFTSIQDGDIKLESEGSILEAVKASDDPFNQARFLINEGDRERAESILASASPDPSDPATTVGRAWELAEMRQDLPAARQLLMDAAGSQHDPMFGRALARLDAIETGDGETADILRARFPERFQTRSNHVRMGRKRLSLRKAAKFRAAAKRWDAAENAKILQDVVDAAEAMGKADSGIETLQAYIQGRLGHDFLESGRPLKEAEEYLEDAARLLLAPRVTIADAFPKVDPADVVDTALTDLCTIAAHSGDQDAELLALMRLREFRVENVSAGKAAQTARDLAVFYDRTLHPDKTLEWSGIAAREFRSAGQMTDAARADLIAVHIHRDHRSWDNALTLAETALGAAEVAQDLQLCASSALEAATAATALRHSREAWQFLERGLPSAVATNRGTARNMLVTMGRIDPVSTGSHALDLSCADPGYFGSCCTEILNRAAAITADDDPRTTIWSRQAAELSLPRLPTDQAFVSLGQALVRLRNTIPPAVVDADSLGTWLSAVDPAELLGPAPRRFIRSLADARLLTLQIGAGQAIVSRLQNSLDRDDASPKELILLCWHLDQLITALRKLSRDEEALALQATFIDLLRRVHPKGVQERELLATSLADRALTLMDHGDHAGALSLQEESIRLFRGLLSQGTDCGKSLALTLFASAESAQRSGEAEKQRQLLTAEAEFLTELAAHPSWHTEDHAWFARERAVVATALESLPATPEPDAEDLGAEDPNAEE